MVGITASRESEYEGGRFAPQLRSLDAASLAIEGFASLAVAEMARADAGRMNV